MRQTWIVLLLILALWIENSVAVDTTSASALPSCLTQFQVSPDVACARIRANQCQPSDSQSFMLDYASLYYCTLGGNIPLFLTVIVALSLGLFYALYVTSDMHLTASLQLLAEKYCRVTPAVAGVTFLAFGNGAPDLFTALNGVDHQVELIFGSAVGSGLFICMFVLGLIIVLASWNKNEEQELQEQHLVAEMLSSPIVLPPTSDSFNSPSIISKPPVIVVEPEEEAVAPSLEIASQPTQPSLLQVPSTADLSIGKASSLISMRSLPIPIASRRNSHSQSASLPSGNRILSTSAPAIHLLHSHSMDDTSSQEFPFRRRHSSSAQRSLKRGPMHRRYQSAASFVAAVQVLQEAEPRQDIEQSISPISQHSNVTFIKRVRPLTRGPLVRHLILYGASTAMLFYIVQTNKLYLWQSITMITIYSLHIAYVVVLQLLATRQQRLRQQRVDQGLDPHEQVLTVRRAELDDKESSISDVSRHIQNLLDRDWKLEFQQMAHAAFLEPLQNWLDKSWWMRIVSLTVMPVQVACSLVMPPLFELEDEKEFGDEENENENENSVAPFALDRLRLILFPWTCLTAMVLVQEGIHEQIGSWPLLSVLLLAVSFPMSVILLLFSRNDRAPSYKPLLVIGCFALCLYWISVASGELVTALDATGTLFQVSSTVLGATVLAWGNSFGDLVADVAIARAGGYETAVTAVFCGPIQNILLSLGISFLKRLLDDHMSVVVIPRADPQLYLAFGFLLASLIGSAVVLVGLERHRVPRWWGYVLIIAYVCGYLPLAILTSLNKLPFLEKR